jgi:hypothetical protein
MASSIWVPTTTRALKLGSIEQTSVCARQGASSLQPFVVDPLYKPLHFEPLVVSL